MKSNTRKKTELFIASDACEAEMAWSQPDDLDPVAQVERALVASILADNALYAVTSAVLSACDFGDFAANAAYGAIEAICEGEIAEVGVADVISVAAIAHERGQGIANLATWGCGYEADEEAVGGWAVLIHEAAAKRRILDTLSESRSVMTGVGPLARRAETVSQMIQRATEIRAPEVKSIGMFAQEALANIVETSEKGSALVGITTGIDDLDLLLAGYQPDQFIVVAGRPSMGKTAFAMSGALAAALKQKKHITIGSLEMSGAELSKRLISILSGVDAALLRVGALSEAQWAAVIEATEVLQSATIDVVDLPGLSLSDITRICAQKKRQGKLDMFILDYLQIADVDGPAARIREQLIADLSRGLKKLARRLHVPIMALSQLNRSLEQRPDKRPMMSDLRESGAIEQDADVILFIYRDQVYNPNTPDVGVAEIIVGKQRSGAVGTVRAGFREKTTQFANLHEVRTGHPKTRQAATFDAPSRDDCLIPPLPRVGI